MHVPPPAGALEVGQEVDGVAALLTAIGYSVTDTVVLFGRIQAMRCRDYF